MPKMRQWKGNTDIGHRAYVEVLRIFPKMKDATLALGCRDNNIYKWGEGVCPSAKYLARLCNAGADVIWILTGRRGGDERTI